MTSDPGTPQDPMNAGAEKPVWQKPWFQFLLGATAVFIFLSFVLPPVFSVIYAVRSVLTPVVFALVLAYICNPLVTYMDKRMRLPRWAGTGILMALATLVVLIAIVVAVPTMLHQGSRLINNLGDLYPKVIASLVDDEAEKSGEASAEDGGSDVSDPSGQQEQPEGTDSVVTEPEKPVVTEAGEQTKPPALADADPKTEGDASESAGDAAAEEDESLFEQLLEQEQVQQMLRSSMNYVANLDWSTVSQTALRSMDVGASVVGSAISVTMYWLVFIMVAVFSFFFLSWKLGEFMNWFIPFIPIDHRERSIEIMKRMDRTVSAWLRGRLLQALLLAIMLTVGWGIAGVPYWLLLGMICGILGLVPYLIFLGWAVALLLAALDSAAGGQFSWWVLFWPTVVYFIAQTIDGWVVEPLLQGKATEMGTLTVLLVVMAGGVLGGLIGLLVAIPVAACVKILCVELLLPKLRELAARRNLSPG